jgi:hypothetical protein
MSTSSIVKFRMETDRNAAIAIDRAVNGVQQSSRNVLEGVRAGVERASWYSSCLFDKYADTCSELSTEDVRFMKCIYEIYKRKDIIADIIKMYIEEELKYLNNNQIQSLDIKLAKCLSNYRSSLLTRAALANTLSLIIVNSFNFKNEILVQLNKSSFIVVTAASLYGKVQMAALSARKLRAISPALYKVLYNNNMEMLYFLVSDKINRALINAMHLRGEERIISIMKTLAY